MCSIAVYEVLTALIDACLHDYQVSLGESSAIICDGASSNQALIKSTHGCSGVYSIDIGTVVKVCVPSLTIV